MDANNILIWVARIDIFLCGLANITKWAVYVLLAAVVVYLVALVVYALIVVASAYVDRAMERIAGRAKNER